jgi:exonuclease III
MTKNLSLKYVPLNCNSLVKQSRSATRSSFIRYLRLQQSDILSLQEVHASDTTVPSVNMHL